MTRIANLPERLIRYRHYGQQVSSRHTTEQQVNAVIARLAYADEIAKVCVWAERVARQADVPLVLPNPLQTA